MSGVSGYEDACGNRAVLECPYSVCDGCPANPKEQTMIECLRAMLDERGAKYMRTIVTEGVLFTVVTRDEHYYILVRDSNAGIKMWSQYLTPEQAIAATLGAGTCRNIAGLNKKGVAGYYFVCSECGLAVHADFGIQRTNYTSKMPDGTTDLRTFNSGGKYEFERCPRCGRKVQP